MCVCESPGLVSFDGIFLVVWFFFEGGGESKGGGKGSRFFDGKLKGRMGN